MKNRASVRRASNSGFRSDDSPRCLARSRMPITPVTCRPARDAELRPSASSMSIQSADISIASAMASASPRSRLAASNRMVALSSMARETIQPSRSPSSTAARAAECERFAPDHVRRNGVECLVGPPVPRKEGGSFPPAPLLCPETARPERRGQWPTPSVGVRGFPLRGAGDLEPRSRGCPTGDSLPKHTAIPGEKPVRGPSSALTRQGDGTEAVQRVPALL